MTSQAEWFGEVHLAPDEHLNGDSFYSDHTGEGFDRNRSVLPLKTVEEVISEAGEGPSWLVENVLARARLPTSLGWRRKVARPHTVATPSWRGPEKRITPGSPPRPRSTSTSPSRAITSPTPCATRG
jgi:hypothetical protein